jgi:hypothetical protein
VLLFPCLSGKSCWRLDGAQIRLPGNLIYTQLAATDAHFRLTTNLARACEQRLPLGLQLNPKTLGRVAGSGNNFIPICTMRLAHHRVCRKISTPSGHGRFPQLKSDLESSITILGKTIFSCCTSDGNKAKASVVSAFFHRPALNGAHSHTLFSLSTQLE